MICVSCGTIEGGRKFHPNTPCSSCGTTLAANSTANLRLAAEAVAIARVRELVEQWANEGLIERTSLDAIRTRLSAPAVPPPEEALAAAKAKLDAETQTHDAARYTEWQQQQIAQQQYQQQQWLAQQQYQQQQWLAQQQYAQHQYAPQPVAETPAPELPADDSSLGEAIGALVALDAPPKAPREPSRWESEVRPLLYENVGWFLGTLLVLAGSIYGVREAWRTLGGVARHVVVAGAFFAYHAMFVGLAALLARKSKATGAVLGSIALGLVPIVFVALSSMVALDAGLGVALSLPFVIASFFTLRGVGKRLDLARPSWLALSVLPAALAELPLARSSPDAAARAAIPFVGAFNLALSMRTRSRAAEVAATYAAVALGLYAVVGGPTAAAVGEVTRAGLVLFAATLAGVVALGAERPHVRVAHPRLSPVVAIVALGALLLAATLSMSVSTTSPAGVRAAQAATACVVTGVFAAVSIGRPAALHVAAIAGPIAGFAIARAVAPSTPQYWPVGAASAASVAFVSGTWLDARRRRLLAGWGTVAAVVSLGAAPILEAVANERGPFVATCATGAVLALGAHGAGGVHRRALHYLGGVAAVIAVMAVRLPPAGDIVSVGAHTFEFAALLFSLAGFVFDLRRAAISDDDPRSTRPFEDLAGFALFGALLVVLSNVWSARAFVLDDPRHLAALEAWPRNAGLAVVGGGFLLRSLRDRSAFPALFGAGVLATLATLESGARSPASSALVFGAIALACAVLANLRGTGEVAEVQGRRVFGAIPLPFARTGRFALGDGFAYGTWVATIATLLCVITWLGNRNEPERARAVMGAAFVVGAHAIGFFGGAFGAFGLRGSVTSLSTVIGLIGFAAAVNRIGRPLPPPVVALKLTLVSIGLWGVSLGAKRWGRGIGRALGDEKSGGRYHRVFEVVVFLVAALLVVDAGLIAGGSVTKGLLLAPPLLAMGPAIAVLLLSRSMRAHLLEHVAAPLLIVAAALLSTQRSLLGSVVAPAITTATAWTRGTFGVAAAGAIFALGAAAVADRARARSSTLALWSTLVAIAALGIGWFRADAAPSVLVLGAGILLAFAERPRAARAVIGIGALLVVHAVAQASRALPWWPGPAIAAIAALALSFRREEDGDAVDFASAAAIFVAIVYALAEGAAPDPLAAGRSVVLGAIAAVNGTSVSAGGWSTARGLPIAALVSGIGLTVSGVRSRSSARSEMVLFAGSALLGLGAATSVIVGHQVLAGASAPPTSLPILLRTLGPAIACALAVAAAIEHALGSFLDERGAGARIGRDFLLFAATLAGVAFVVLGRTMSLSPSRTTLIAGFLALGVAAGTAAHAAFRERSGRHVYFVQLAIVGAYALVRSELATDVPPEGDAIFALVFGFLLLGVTVHARRADIPEVGAAVRRFIALLPIGIALVMPRRASDSAALIAAATAALYGALAWLEKSRWLGSLGAAACNVALLVLALSHGIDGNEVYAAALGLFVLALGHLFASSMDHGGRLAVRVIGGLLLYAPAAARLALDLARAQSGGYAIGFGAACLAGVLLGMILQIRAYLAFGTGFLVLDVLANLTAAGIRDHRIGFLVLSLTGIGILGAMVFVTLQRDRVRGWSRALRIALRGWD